MQREMPFFEDAEQALTAAVQALGGAKTVGASLWPDKSVEDARKLLLDCLNSSRPEKLKLSQVIMIFRSAKQAGFHGGFEWFARECEYESRPITKAEEIDRLSAVIEQSSKTLAQSLAVLERLQRDSK